MKKILSLIVALTLSIGVLSSCEKDSSEQTLAGTAWETTIPGSATSASTIETYTFAEDTFNYTSTDADDGAVYGTFNGPYTYDGTKVTGTLTGTGGGDNTITIEISGTVSGNEMTLATKSGSTLTLTKK